MFSVPVSAYSTHPSGTLDIRSVSTRALLLLGVLALFIPGHLFDWTLERVFVFLIAFVPIVLLFWDHKIRLTSQRLALIGIFLLLEVVYLFSYLVSITQYQVSTGVRDYLELPRYAIWACFLYLATGVNSRQFVRLFVGAIKIAIVYSAIALAAWYADLGVVSTLFRDYLYVDTKTAIEFGWIRFSIPFENPNYLGFVLVMSLAFLLFFQEHSKRFIWVPVILLLLFCTGSRTAWFTTALVLGLFCMHYIIAAAHRLNGRQLLAAATVFAAAALALTFVLDELLDTARVAVTVQAIEGGNLRTDPNFEDRVIMVEQTLMFLHERPLLGWGTTKYATMHVVDNQFAIWGLRLGLIGTGLVTIVLVTHFVWQWKTSAEDRFKVGILAFWASIFLMVQTGAFLENFRLAVLFVCFVVAIDGVISSRSVAHGLRK